MKKLLLLMTLCLFSCGYNLINFEKVTIITKVEPGNSGDVYHEYKQGCFYYTSNHCKNTTWDTYFFDYCGLYKVGDTVKIIKK